MNKTVKNIIMFVVILIIIAVVYFVFFGGKAPVETANTNGSLQSSSGAPVSGIIQDTPASSIEASQIGQEFVNQLLSLQAIKLDDEVFSSLAFQSLEDFTIVLVQPGNEGRTNPFAPFGSDNTDPNATAPAPGFTEGGLNVIPINDTLPGPNGS